MVVIPMKISQHLLGSKGGSKFWWLPWFPALQMFAGIYRDFAGKSECRDFKFTHNPCNFWSKSKKVWTFYIYSLLRFFKFPYNFCGDFRHTCNPRDNYMHFTGYVLRHGDPPTFYGGKICSVLFYWLMK